jgi:hypothetical protein
LSNPWSAPTRRAPGAAGAGHEDGLRAAAADGELWKLRITSVPEPQETRAYIEDALQMRADGNRFAFAVVDDTTGTCWAPPATTTSCPP